MKNRSIRRYFVDHYFEKRVAELAASSSPDLVLDLGGHKNVKRGLFDISNFGFTVVCLNLSPEKGADLLADAAFVPLAGATFDLVVCGELLEHVPDPKPVLREIYRVLKPGGTVLITVPFLFRIHADPFDFGRYTDRYWELNINKVGFEIFEVEKQGLFYAVISNFIEQYLQNIRPPKPFGRPIQSIFRRFITNPLKRFALWREAKPHIRDDRFLSSFTTGFGIQARKPQGEG